MKMTYIPEKSGSVPSDEDSVEQFDFDASVEAIISNERIVTHFQPIISIKKREIAGFEALSRGVAENNGNLITPDRLYGAALKKGRTLALDRLCRKKALENFQNSLSSHERRQLLFVNFEASLLDEGVGGSGHMMDLASQLSLHPSDIVIEIVESKVKDIKALQNFVETYRYYGFLIALDDVGAGHSNFDRISLIKPDILKINRDIITAINDDYYKQQVFKSLANLSHNIGTLVVAEGVETEEETLQCLMLGADLFQGYYFKRPGAADFIRQAGDLLKKISQIADRYTKHEISKIREANKRQRLYAGIMRSIVNSLASMPAPFCEKTLRKTVQELILVEAIYIVDQNGIQVTNTILNTSFILKKHKLFQPAQKGDDHSLKEYIYPLLNTSLRRFTTERYISLATGTVCRTVSASFKDMKMNSYILCVDFREDGRM